MLGSILFINLGSVYSSVLILYELFVLELIQTEMHHVRTLKIMLLVYMHELRDTLQLDERRLDCLFPQLESLLKLHSDFLSRLREQRQETLEPGSDRNYVIHSVADILSEQVIYIKCIHVINKNCPANCCGIRGIETVLKHIG